MKRLVLGLDGLMVVALGTYMLILSQSEAYAMFMNPKFSMLTAVTAVGLCVTGVAFILAPKAGPNALRTLSFFGLTLLILIAGTEALKSHSGFAAAPPATRITPEPFIIKNGKTYLKANPARLFFLLKSPDGPSLDQGYVTRGVACRSVPLDRLGRFVILRVNMVCCFADAMAMGAIIEVGKTPQPQHGDWVTVFGEIRPLPEPQAIPGGIKVDDVPFTMVYEKAVVVAEIIEKIERPRFPYVFELPPAGNGTIRLTGEDDDY